MTNKELAVKILELVGGKDNYYSSDSLYYKTSNDDQRFRNHQRR